jgi:hypothetical protein
VLCGKAIERYYSSTYCASASVINPATAVLRNCNIAPNYPVFLGDKVFAVCRRGGSPIYRLLPFKRGTPHTRPIVNCCSRLRQIEPIEFIRPTSGIRLRARETYRRTDPKPKSMPTLDGQSRVGNCYPRHFVCCAKNLPRLTVRAG